MTNLLKKKDDFYDYQYKNKDKYSDFYFNYCIPAIYTNYLSNKINLYGEPMFRIDTTHDICFGISTKILKDQPFIAYESTSYGRGAFVKQRKGFYGLGNLTKKPVLDNLVEIINKRLLETNYHFDQLNEVMFDKIPLKYIEFILVKKAYIKRVKCLFPYIPVIRFKNYDEDLMKKIDMFFQTPKNPQYKKNMNFLTF